MFLLILGGALSGAGGGSKRKSRNPTRIHQSTNLSHHTEANDEGDYSSDDDDEGFENPLDDNDDDIIDHDHDNDEDGNGGASCPPGSNNQGSGPGKK